MRRLRLLLLVASVLPALSGCMLVDLAVDPVGCGTGTHKPIFPWYPCYLWNPEMRKYGEHYRNESQTSPPAAPDLAIPQ